MLERDRYKDIRDLVEPNGLQTEIRGYLPLFPDYETFKASPYKADRVETTTRGDLEWYDTWEKFVYDPRIIAQTGVPEGVTPEWHGFGIKKEIFSALALDDSQHRRIMRYEMPVHGELELTIITFFNIRAELEALVKQTQPNCDISRLQHLDNLDLLPFDALTEERER